MKIGMISTLGLLAVFGLIVVPATARSENPDTTKPPPVMDSAGPFTARHIVDLPTIEGRQWIEVEVHTGHPSRTIRAPGGGFSLTLAGADTDTGDFTRYVLLFQRGREPAVRIAQTSPVRSM
jgi:hypothetical protein